MSKVKLAMRAEEEHTLEITVEDISKLLAGQTVHVRNLTVTLGAFKNKPPLGLVPLETRELTANIQRLVEVKAAIGRYQKAGADIPMNWLVEHRNLQIWLKSKGQEDADNDPF